MKIITNRPIQENHSNIFGFGKNKGGSDDSGGGGGGNSG